MNKGIAVTAPAATVPKMGVTTEETWYVLEGELGFRVGEETFTAGAGATVFVPPRVGHALANRSSSAARFLLTTSPSGHDRYFV
jgi:mannose-6-phosphate isomerase-like protein (cupin superfamily)